MGQTPEERLERLRWNCVRGWERVRSDPAERELARQWLARHPSGEREADELWREALEGRGALAAWLASGADLGAFPPPLPCHTVLASHPFAALPPWPIPKTSRAS